MDSREGGRGRKGAGRRKRQGMAEGRKEGRTRRGTKTRQGGGASYQKRRRPGSWERGARRSDDMHNKDEGDREQEEAKERGRVTRCERGMGRGGGGGGEEGGEGRRRGGGGGGHVFEAGSRRRASKEVRLTKEDEGKEEKKNRVRTDENEMLRQRVRAKRSRREAIGPCCQLP
eukprot:766914-Hanusia_phi.AAC.8